MAKYKITEKGVQNTETGVFITNKKSRAWRTYEAWLAEGNTPLPMDVPIIPVPPVTEQMIDDADGIPEIKAILKLMIGY